MEKINNQLSNKDFSKIYSFISEELIKAMNFKELLEKFNFFKNNSDKIKIIEKLNTLKWINYEGENRKIYYIKKSLFDFIDLFSLDQGINKLFHLIDSKEEQNLNKNDKILNTFIGHLLKAKLRKRKRVPFKISLDINDVIKTIKYDFKYIEEKIQIPEDSLKLSNFSDGELIDKIDSLLNKKIDIPIKIPLLSYENIIYDEIGRYFTGQKTELLNKNNPNFSLKKILHVAEIVKELIISKSYKTIENIYIEEKVFFKDLESIKLATKYLALIIGTFYDNLHILNNIAGNIKGPLIIKTKFREFDISKSKSYIVPIDGNIEIIDSSAVAIILIENTAEMIKLSLTNFWKRFPCILISTTHFPNHILRYIIKNISSTFKIPIFGIFDLTPRGIKNLLSFVYSNVELASETPKLALNNFYWLGLFPNDINTYKLNKENIVKMNIEDLNDLNMLLEQKSISKNPNLKDLLKIILENKNNIQLFNINGHYEYNFPNYILSKIQNKAYIKL